MKRLLLFMTLIGLTACIPETITTIDLATGRIDAVAEHPKVSFFVSNTWATIRAGSSQAFHVSLEDKGARPDDRFQLRNETNISGIYVWFSPSQLGAHESATTWVQVAAHVPRGTYRIEISASLTQTDGWSIPHDFETLFVNVE
jgi:hypothetical protein